MDVNKTILGDCVYVMKELIGAGVQAQTIITSPPYYGLRNYGVDGQIGLEETPELFIEKLTNVFDVAYKLIKDDGTLWLNIGDSYCGTGDKGNYKDPKYKNGRNGQSISMTKNINGIKSKDLIGIPWMLAFALRSRGWYLRQDIIWAKPNVMPESVKDRCTKSHEYIFLFSKNKTYKFNNEAIKEKSVSGDGNPPRGSLGAETKNSGRRHQLDGSQSEQGFRAYTEYRNKRDVWFIPSNSNSHESGGHFATFPEELVENCVLAGSNVGDLVFDPFMGSGTVGKVAQNLGRKWLGAELNPNYINIQRKRTSQQALELVV